MTSPMHDSSVTTRSSTQEAIGSASTQTHSDVVVIRGLTKAYRRGNQSVEVLRNIDIVVPRGAFIALMGPSGSGKSTLLNIIAGLDTPSSGVALVMGTEIAKLKERELDAWRAKHIGFVFQSYNLIPVLTAVENVELPLMIRGLPVKQQREQATRMLERVGLVDRSDHYPSQLSGGEQQRVALARALVGSPPLVIADEPTGDLDRASATHVLTLLRSLSADSNTTIVMVTHDPEAAEVANTTYRLSKGELLGES